MRPHVAPLPMISGFFATLRMTEMARGYSILDWI
jgi:hypothetical protein